MTIGDAGGDPLDPQRSQLDALLLLATGALGHLADEVVFVGGATIGLWLDNPGSAVVLPTDDVDVIVQIVTRGDLRRFEERLDQHGFTNDTSEGAPLCRYVHRERSVVLDVMPIDADVLGFSNQWFAEAWETAVIRSGIRVAQPQMLIATKLAAWSGRGENDLLGSKDVHDVLTLIDGRSEIASDVEAASDEARLFIQESLRGILDHPDADNAILGAMAAYGSLADQAAERARQRITEIIADYDEPRGAAD